MDILWAAPGDLNYQYGPSGTELSNLIAKGANREVSANFVVTYDAGFTAVPAAQAAFQAAVDIWANIVVSPAPIRINAQYKNLGNPNILGSAGAGQICTTSAGVSNTFYAAALADKLNGSAYCAALGGASYEINANFNNTFANWDFGTSGTPVGGKYNFLTVVLHEVGHGLGFFGSMTSDGTNGSWGFGVGIPHIYDRFAVTGASAPLLGLTNPSAALHAQLTSNNTFFNGSNGTAGNGGSNPKLETHNFNTAYGVGSAVNGWLQGSSYSHIDDLAYTGTSNGLMTWSLNTAEVYTDPGPIMRGMFVDEGWTLAVAGVTTERVALGAGPYGTDGGWFAVRNGRDANLSLAMWNHLPWSAYDATGGGLHLAAGDVDGDGLDEIVAGLGSGGAGWIAVFDDAAHGYALLRWIQVTWPTYNNANGEVWPAVGDLDNDGKAEIVAGLGTGGAGWYEIFDDASANYAHLAWKQVNWGAYNGGSNGSTHPAIGNFDGAGGSEIVLGLGSGSNGWLEVVSGTAGGYAHQNWFQVAYPSYDASNGTTYPAAGDIDGDGRAEVVVGLGNGGGGWIEVVDDANAGFAIVRWLQVSWPAYNAGPGETHPAVGNIDADARAEIVIGLAQFAPSGGWFETLDDGVAGNVSLGWHQLEWAAFGTAGGATYPAVGKFR